MCLVPKQNWFRKTFHMKPKIKIARKNIKVYKLLECSSGRLFSYFFTWYEWELNKIQASPIVITTQKYAIKETTNVLQRWIIEQGLHSYLDPNMCISIKRFPSLIKSNLYNAIIPKGSHYIIGDEGDIVSDRLIITNKYKE